MFLFILRNDHIYSRPCGFDTFGILQGFYYFINNCVLAISPISALKDDHVLRVIGYGDINQSNIDMS